MMVLRSGKPIKGATSGRCRVLACSTLFLISSCGSTSSYMGVSLPPGAADPALQQLAARARAGDKQAQLDLGIRFEEGNGVAKDRKRATRLYRQAASNSGGMIWVYSPSPGGGAPARVVPVENGAAKRGLEQAKERLRAIAQSEERQR